MAMSGFASSLLSKLHGFVSGGTVSVLHNHNGRSDAVAGPSNMMQIQVGYLPVTIIVYYCTSPTGFIPGCDFCFLLLEYSGKRGGQGFERSVAGKTSSAAFRFFFSFNNGDLRLMSYML